MSGRRYPPVEDRFWAKVDKTSGLGPAGSCWEWRGHVDSGGYGTIRCDGIAVATHRLSWRLANGDLPQANGHHGACICHRCDNRRCVNPEHLFVGSHSDNMADASAKKRLKRPVGQGSHRAKLTDAQVIAIRSDSRKLLEVAKAFGVSPTTVSGIRRRQIWTHVKEEGIFG